jgi:hypothetical protein
MKYEVWIEWQNVSTNKLNEDTWIISADSKEEAIDLAIYSSPYKITDWSVEEVA